MNIGIIGAGNVCGSLSKLFAATGLQVMFGMWLQIWPSN